MKSFCFILVFIIITGKPTLALSMEFKNLHLDIECDCIDGCNVDTNTTFALRTLGQTLSEDDFISYWDLGRRPQKSNSCHSKCALKAQSMSIMNDESKDDVTNIYKEIFPLVPAYIQYLTIIKFKEDCGMTKPSPSYRNKHHYSFYKCDEFKLENVELISSVNLHI